MCICVAYMYYNDTVDLVKINIININNHEYLNYPQFNLYVIGIFFEMTKLIWRKI